MDTEKRIVIVNEIERWRKSKLLPEQYCVFLLNLYQEDSIVTTPADRGKTAKQSMNPKVGLFGAAGLAVISLFSYFLVNLTSYHLGLQIGGSLGIVMICYGIGAFYRTQKPLISYIIVGAASIFLLVIGEYILKINSLDKPIWILEYIAFCGVVWLLFGLFADMGMMQFIGWVGLVLFYGFLLRAQLDSNIHWLQVQLCWMPLSIIYAWGSWLLQSKLKTISIVLLAIASLLWFAPEVYSIFATELTGMVIQFSVIGKVIILALTVYMLRKKWIDWVK